ncbi:MAG: alpha/beta hydrolase [Pseudomonadota bacterium]
MRYLALLALAPCAGCVGDYTALEFQSSGTALVAMGTIDDTTPGVFNAVLARHPQADTLVLRSIAGSVDDDANLAFSRAVRSAGLDTVVPGDGMVASGGTDLFLAGVRRTIEPGACVGVHSWGSGFTSGATVPRSDPVHEAYLSYYDDMEIDRNFYWFTLEAAPADAMHWMTAAETRTFGMATEPVSDLSPAPVCETR